MLDREPWGEGKTRLEIMRDGIGIKWRGDSIGLMRRVVEQVEGSSCTRGTAGLEGLGFGDHDQRGRRGDGDRVCIMIWLSVMDGNCKLVK